MGVAAELETFVIAQAPDSTTGADWLRRDEYAIEPRRDVAPKIVSHAGEPTRLDHSL